MKRLSKIAIMATMSTALMGLPAAAIAAGPYVPYGAIAAEWHARGGAAGFLGAPTSPEYDVYGVPGARTEEFYGGTIYWSPATGAHEVHGAILGQYITAAPDGAGGPSIYGLPVTDEMTTPDGIGRYNHFQGARSIYWTPDSGAHTVYGSIRSDWSAGGWELGPLGYPISNEFEIAGQAPTRIQYFQRGLELWSSSTGAHEVHGDILSAYANLGGLGGPTAFLGLPLTDETPAANGGRFNNFQGGAIYWTSTTGAYEVHGSILGKYRDLGGPSSFLGAPMTNETPTPNGVGRFNDFQSGAIYWTPATGAHEVHGDILREYRGLGGPGSFLGSPLSDEMTLPDGVGRINYFQGGSIYWTPATGAHEVHGQIESAWASTGWELGPLGYPTSDEFDAASIHGRQSNFQHGYIFWVNGVVSIHVS
jgi:uncharacterized protein with LGFP repeats